MTVDESKGYSMALQDAKSPIQAVFLIERILKVQLPNRECHARFCGYLAGLEDVLVKGGFGLEITESLEKLRSSRRRGA